MTSILTENNNCLTTFLPDVIQYPDQGILTKLLFKDSNCQYSLFSLAKGTEIDEHTSTRNALVFVIEGQGIFTLNGEKIALKTGVLILIPANAPHALEAQENLAFILSLSEHHKPVKN